LYLVSFEGWQKFGVGYEDRIHAHRRQGARVTLVLSAKHRDVWRAEQVLKARFRRQFPDLSFAGMPATFGTGTEVVPIGTEVDLTEVLPGTEDVTHRFRAPDTT
jgi:hypothetical protein